MRSRYITAGGSLPVPRRRQAFVARALREADELLKKRLPEASEDQAKEESAALQLIVGLGP